MSFWLLVVLLVPSSAWSADTAPQASSHSYSLSGTSSWSSATAALMQLEETPTEEPSEPATSETPSEQPTQEPTEQPSETESAESSPQPSSPEPSPEESTSEAEPAAEEPMSMSTLAEGTCGTPEAPCTVALTVDTEAWMLLAAALLVAATVALLITAWGNSGD